LKLSAYGPGTIAVQHHQGATILVLRGEHDASTAQSVDQAINQALENGPVIIDLTDVAFLDSTIIGTFVKHAGPNDTGITWKLALVLPPSGMVLRVLRLVAIEQIIPVYGSVSDAVGESAGAARRLIDPH
jgi:anti-anti-sigma factor